MQTTKTAGINCSTFACRLASSASPSEIRRRNAEMQSPVPKPPHLSDLLAHVNVKALPSLACKNSSPEKRGIEAFLTRKMVIAEALGQALPPRPMGPCPACWPPEEGPKQGNQGGTAGVGNLPPPRSFGHERRPQPSRGLGSSWTLASSIPDSAEKASPKASAPASTTSSTNSPSGASSRKAS